MTTREILRQAQLARWEWIRRLGFRQYVLRFGVVAYGLPMFILMTFFVNRQQNLPLKYPFILISVVIWAGAGWLFGWITWRSSEKKYREATKNTSAPAQKA